MYTLNVRFKLSDGSMQEFRRLLQQRITPLLRKQKGFHDEIALITSNRNEALTISFWDSRENTDAYLHLAYLDVLRALSKVVVSLPVLERFEVIDSTVHEITSSAA